MQFELLFIGGAAFKVLSIYFDEFKSAKKIFTTMAYKITPKMSLK